MMRIKTIMVVGAGQMGRGIAHVAAQKGYSVLLHDLQPSILTESLAELNRSLAEKSPPTKSYRQEEHRQIGTIAAAESLKESVHTDFVIEAATENFTIKTQIFQTLANHITEETVLASNTSSLSISELADATDCPERVIGMHFMNPVEDMLLVEIIKGMKTSDKTNEIARDLTLSLGKEPIDVNDYPGFVSNRLIMPMINEAIILVFDEVAEIEAVDKIMKVGMHHPMGPLQMADMIGLDTCLSIMETLHRELDDPKYRPCPLLRNMVKAGKLGRKSGEGFYLYSN